MSRSDHARPGAALLVLGGALAGCLSGCSSRTDVSASGNVPGAYSHVYISAQAVWFNASATAGPDDAGWEKFSLSTPATIDLVADSNGNFGTLVTDLKLPPRSYAQVRLIPVDASVPLIQSAQTLGASFNMEADYVDTSGTTHQLPLELLSPDRGIGIQASLPVPFGNIGAALAATTPATSTTGTTTSATTTLGTSNTTSTASTGSTGSTSTTTRTNFALSIDGARDLTAFTYSGVSGVMLSSHASAYDLSTSGGIQGTLTLTGITSASGAPSIQVSAEQLSADGSRHLVRASTPVSADGTFTLYPLTASASNTTDYDLVIHGDGIATIIIKQVQIPATGTSASSTTGTTTTTCPTTSTGTGSSSNTTSNTSTSTNCTTGSGFTPIVPTNLVSIGTLIPRAASAYAANIAAPAGSPLPAGAAVAFYQTLAAAGEVPYVIEVSAIDPFNQNFAHPQMLSAGTVDSGTYVSSGATITVVSAAAHEGAGTYQVAATAPLYADGTLGIPVTAPAAGTTTPVQVTVAALSLAAGSTSASLSASVTAPAGKYNQGELLVSNNGQLVASASLAAVLGAGGGTVQVSVPGGTPSSLYYLTVRVWSSADPAASLSRQWFATPVDLRSAGSASAQLTVN